MPVRTRRGAVAKAKQHQYRITDDEDEENLPVKSNGGDILASLSTNVPPTKTKNNNKKGHLVRGSSRKNSENPPSSVIIAKKNNMTVLSPPTQAKVNYSSETSEEEFVDDSMDDGVSAISCDVFSPPEEKTKTKKRFIVDDDESESESDDEVDEEDSLDNQEEVSHNVEEMSSDDETKEFEPETDEEEEVEEEASESEDDYESYDESVGEEEFQEPEDDDEYDPDEEEEESVSEEEFDDFIEDDDEEEEKPKTRGRPRATRQKASKKKEEEKEFPSPKPTTTKSEVKTPIKADSDDCDDTDIEETPAVKVSNTKMNIMESPEAHVAVIVDDDEDYNDDDVLVATIIDEDEITGGNKDMEGDADDEYDEEDDMTVDYEPDAESSFGEQEDEDDSHSIDENDENLAGNALVATMKTPKKNAKDSDLVKTLKSAKKNAVNPNDSKNVEETSLVKTLKSEKKVKKTKKDKSRRKTFFRQEGTVKRGKWTLGAKIGVGSFGVVHVGMNTSNGRLMAVKVFEMDGAIKQDIRQEVELMRSLKHPNIVRYLGAQMNKTHLHIFQEWVPGGSVASMLSKFGAFPFQVIRSYLSQTLAGLAYLHENNILHRDIKGSNILVNDEGIVKLADFGASKKLASFQEDLMMSMTVRGTPYFMSPEVFEEKYSSKADIWGIGCVAFQMFTANPPWKDQGFTNPISLFNHLKRHDGPPSLPVQKETELANEDKQVRQLFERLLHKCFLRDPSLRPSASKLLDDPFFIEMHDEDDEEATHYRGLFSPGNETTSSHEGSPNTSIDTLNRSIQPSPQKLFHAQSERQLKSTFLSPPRPKRNGKQSKSPYPMQYKSPQTTISPKPDSSDWPEWARQDKDNTLSYSPATQQSEQNLSNLMDSLALSEDTTRNPFASTVQSKSSLLGSTDANTSHLIGLDFLEKTERKDEF